MHKSWGSNPICFWTLVVFNWYLIPMTCLFGRQTFLVLVLCAIMRSVEGLVYSLMIFSSIGILFSLVSFQSGIFTHVLIWIFDIIWTLCFLVTLVCALLVYLVFCLNYILFGSWKSCACIFIICIFFGMLTFVDPIYRINSIKS